MVALIIVRVAVFIFLAKMICARQTVRLTATSDLPGRVAQSVARLTHEPEVPGSIPGPATYFRFLFRCVMKGSCQLLAKVCARSTG